MMQNSNNFSPESVVTEYLPLVKKIACGYHKCGLALDDLIQEGMLGLLKACHRFDSERNTQFSTYASYWIKKYMLSAISKEIRHTFSTSNIEKDKLPDSKTPAEPPSLFQKNSSAEIMFQADLPDLERQILILSYKQGRAIKDIAQTLNLSSEKVKQIRTKALRRIRQYNPGISNA
jgi:RNA polymerase sigma factor (sigma-70 family)